MGHVFADFQNALGPLIFVAVLIISGIVNSQREKAKREKERRTLQENLDTREKRTETHSIPVARPRQQQSGQMPPAPRRQEAPPPLRPAQPSQEQAKPISVQDLLNTMLGGIPVQTPKNPPPIQPQQRREPVQRPRQQQAPPQQPQRRPVQAAPPQARPAAAQPSPAPRPVAAQQAAPKRMQRRKKQGSFLGSLGDVRRGIVLREVLGPPKAFTDWPG